MLGSEGCLGIITSVVVKVVPLPQVSEHASFLFRDFKVTVPGAVILNGPSVSFLFEVNRWNIALAPIPPQCYRFVDLHEGTCFFRRVFCRHPWQVARLTYASMSVFLLLEMLFLWAVSCFDLCNSRTILVSPICVRGFLTGGVYSTSRWKFCR